MSGLNMSKEQFQGLKQNAKLDVLFDNQCETIRLVKGYKLYQKVTAIVGGFLVTGVGFIFFMLLNHLQGK